LGAFQSGAEIQGSVRKNEVKKLFNGGGGGKNWGKGETKNKARLKLVGGCERMEVGG